MSPSDIKYLVVHCSASPPSMNVDASVIDRWHRTKGWLKIGYHFVIKRNGVIQEGRKTTEVGAHVAGYNSKSLGICLVGGISDADGTPENNFTDDQFHSLAVLLAQLKEQMPGAVILGHRDLPNVKKACPSFDVREWVATTTTL